MLAAEPEIELPIFPCRADKKPTCPGGFYAASADPRIIDKLWRLWPGPLTGVPTGETSGLAVLDVDVKNNGEAWLSEFECSTASPLPGFTALHPVEFISSSGIGRD
jgi:hypothetical protein